MEKLILEHLAEVERTEKVTILFACESGSRAWGFPSADSDYDVRFLYAHPAEWYLSIDERRDVIERPLRDLIDLSGWDVRKALRLFRKSNPPLMEWLGSPTMYLERFSLAANMRRLMPEYWSSAASAYHYLHMATGIFREYLRGERVRTKKYFYVLRPVFAVLWIERGLGAVPTEFARLMRGLELRQEVTGEVERLMEAKRAGEELDDGPRIQVLNDFLEEQLARLEQISFTQDKRAAPTETLDELFRSTLAEIRSTFAP